MLTDISVHTYSNTLPEFFMLTEVKLFLDTVLGLRVFQAFQTVWLSGSDLSDLAPVLFPSFPSILRILRSGRSRRGSERSRSGVKTNNKRLRELFTSKLPNCWQLVAQFFNQERSEGEPRWTSAWTASAWMTGQWFCGVCSTSVVKWLPVL